MTTRSLTHEQAEAIARAVLGRHAITISDAGNMGLIAGGLGIASDPVSLWDNRHWVESRHRSAAKIAALRSVLAFYAARGYDGAYQSAAGNFRSEAHGLMYELFEKDLEAVIAGVDALLKVEQRILDTTPDVKIPNKRPTSAKSDGAGCIFEILSQEGVDAWKSCEIIADMLTEAGIVASDRREKEQRALYDRLRRQSGK